jgi:hypothetical protein
VTRKEYTRELAQEIWEDHCARYLSLEAVENVIGRAITYGYVLASLEVAERDARDIGTPTRA